MTTIFFSEHQIKSILDEFALKLRDEDDNKETKLIVLEGGFIHGAVVKVDKDLPDYGFTEPFELDSPLNQITCLYGPREDSQPDIWYHQGILIKQAEA